MCIIAPQIPPVSAPGEVTIFDISCGGIGVIDSTIPSGIETGVCYRRCRIVLPEIGTVTTDILVKSTFEVTLKSRSKHMRAGCQFIDMPEHDRGLIQRYISRLERERKDRASGR
jgi:c-di-GMP-binding flagellar brake protein YcgR